MDLSHLSDEQLERMARGEPDYQSMSDDDLRRIAEGPTSKTESALRGAAQGASLGFADEVAGGVEALWEKAQGNPEKFGNLYARHRDESRGNFKKAKADNPKTYLAGELGGGVTSALVPIGSAATIGRAAILGAGLGGVAGVGGSEGKDAMEVTEDGLIGAGGGAILGAGGAAAGKVLSKGATMLGERIGPRIAEALPVGKKPNAAEIETAANMLGTKATPGMTSASEIVPQLESSLHQAPTIGGYLTRRATKPVGKAMSEATEDLVGDAATISPFESGEQAKKILSKEIENKFASSKGTFNELSKYTKDIPANPGSIKAVSRNIMKIPEVETLELPLARQIVNSLEKNPSVDQIKTLRTMVGKKAKSAVDGAESSAYWQIYAKLGRLEENSLKRGVISSARTAGEGDTIAKGMLGQLKGAKKSYSSEMGRLEDFSEASRLGKVNSPDSFIDKLNSIKSENLQQKLLPLEDVRLAEATKSQFPEAFGVLRKARIRDLSEGVVRDGEHVPGKFIQNVKGLNPETETMLFGDKAPKLNALRTVNQSLPEKVGPSGTSQALDLKEMLNPITQGRDLARYASYKYASSDKLAKLAEFLKSKPAFQSMAETNPKAFQAAVYDLSKRVRPGEAMSKVAGPGQQPVDEDKAREAFLDNN